MQINECMLISPQISEYMCISFLLSINACLSLLQISDYARSVSELLSVSPHEFCVQLRGLSILYNGLDEIVIQSAFELSV